MPESILDSTKKALGLSADYDVFDQDIIMLINGVFSTLNQLGIGPVGGFFISDDSETWDTFLGTDPRLNFVKTYLFLKVRYTFDPPNSGFVVTAMKEQIQEYEWRLNVYAEGAFGDPSLVQSVPQIIIAEDPTDSDAIVFKET